MTVSDRTLLKRMRASVAADHNPEVRAHSPKVSWPGPPRVRPGTTAKRRRLNGGTVNHYRVTRRVSCMAGLIMARQGSRRTVPDPSAPFRAAVCGGGESGRHVPGLRDGARSAAVRRPP